MSVEMPQTAVGCPILVEEGKLDGLEGPLDPADLERFLCLVRRALLEDLLIDGAGLRQRLGAHDRLVGLTEQLASLLPCQIVRLCVGEDVAVGRRP